MSRRQLSLFPVLIASVLLLMFALVTDASAASFSHDSAAASVTHCGANTIGIGLILNVQTPTFLLAAVSDAPYLSWWKLLLVVVTYLFWVWASDWLNRDAVKIARDAEIDPAIWNLIGVLSMLAGFFAAISIPIFWAGYPLMLIAAVTPVVSYRMMRRAKIKGSQRLRRKLSSTGEDDVPAEVLAQDQGVAMSITAAGDTDPERSAALVKARQSSGFVDLKELLHQGMLKRADLIQIDYSQSQATPRLFVDGTWHALPVMNRESGDAMLVSLKRVGGLKPDDRRSKQSGSFSLKSELGKAQLSVTSKGVRTGERVRVKYIQAAKEILRLPQLGMFPSMANKFVKGLNEQGITIVSAPKKHGLTTTWRGVLVSADRLTRDCVVLMDDSETESDIENVTPKEFDNDQAAAGVLKQAMLSQPDSVAVPRVPSPEFMDMLSVQVNEQDRAAWLRTSASTAAEALLRTYSLAGNREDFRKAVKHVTCQRLVRRLCEHCKLDVPVSPKMIKQLGGDPTQIKTISGPWKLPPPEQRVDENGREIEFPPCQTCGGLGYIGRIAVFELIKVNDQVRAALKKSPKVAAIDAAAKESKAKKSMKSNAFQLVLMGVTSFQEVQSVLNQK